MEEHEKIRILVLLNNLKVKLRMSLNNDLYQQWARGDMKIKFRDWVIDKQKEEIDKLFT